MKVLARRLLATVALTLVATTSVAQGDRRVELSGRWQGVYAYQQDQRRKEVSFAMDLVQRGQSLTGRVTEQTTIGDRPPVTLHATLVGIVEGRRLRFIKTYDGTGGQSHSVYYEGMLTPGAMSVSGKWIVADDWSGTFEAKRIAP